MPTTRARSEPRKSDLYYPLSEFSGASPKKEKQVRSVKYPPWQTHEKTSVAKPRVARVAVEVTSGIGKGIWSDSPQPTRSSGVTLHCLFPPFLPREMQSHSCNNLVVDCYTVTATVGSSAPCSQTPLSLSAASLSGRTSGPLVSRCLPRGMAMTLPLNILAHGERVHGVGHRGLAATLPAVAGA